MLDITVHKNTLGEAIINTVIDIILVILLFQMWNLSDIEAVIKIVASSIVSILGIVRWIYFFKDRKDIRNNGGKD